MTGHLIDIYDEDRKLIFDPLPTAGVLAFAGGRGGFEDSDKNTAYGYMTLIPRYASPWLGGDRRVVVNEDLFLTKFHWFTNNLLKSIDDWENIAVTGKLITECLLPHTNPPFEAPTLVNVNLVYHSSYKSGTIISVLERLEKSVKAANPNADCTCARDGSVVVFDARCGGNLIGRFRITEATVLSLYLSNQSIDCFGCCYSGTVLLTRKALFSFNHRSVVPDLTDSCIEQRRELASCALLGFQTINFKSEPSVFVKHAPEALWTGPRSPKSSEVRHAAPGTVTLSKEAIRALDRASGLSQTTGKRSYELLVVTERSEPGPSKIRVSKAMFPNLLQGNLTDAEKRRLLVELECKMTNDTSYSPRGLWTNIGRVLQSRPPTVTTYNSGLLKNIRATDGDGDDDDHFNIYYDVPCLSYIVSNDLGTTFCCEGPLSDVFLKEPPVVPMQGYITSSDNVFSLFEVGRQVCKAMRRRRLIACCVYSLLQCGIPADCLSVVVSDYYYSPFAVGLPRSPSCRDLPNAKPISSLVVCGPEPKMPPSLTPLLRFPVPVFNPSGMEWLGYYSGSDANCVFNCARAPKDPPEASYYGRLFQIAVASDNETAAEAEMETINSRRKWLNEKVEQIMKEVDLAFGSVESLSRLNI
eukprot:TRINITY_DN17941_c0_g1_i1.p1 TRINITY_DN17941_c0_g1~~TRINITY_DN17941_c0_g1_i1.p1  ORF type:complete len:640 (+),score=89.34 TRINITY_DN17941_c0_g1_i1:279-2198(+)